jgi:cell division protein FtsQ
VLAGLALVAVLCFGGWLWLRDSSLVAIKRVVVTGLSGPDASRIRAALVRAGRTMTTLDVRADQLRTAVAPYAAVKDLRITTQFPHGLRIRVIEHIPVAVLSAGGHSVAVAGDGTILKDVPPASSLPAIPLRAVPGGSKLTDPGALGAVSLLAAAPYQLLAQIGQVSPDGPHGLLAQLRNGPALYFGDARQLAAKWIAAQAVLADPGSAGAAYIDVTDPERPAAGASTSSSSAVAGAAASTATTSTTPSTPPGGG